MHKFVEILWSAQAQTTLYVHSPKSLPSGAESSTMPSNLTKQTLNFLVTAVGSFSLPT